MSPSRCRERDLAKPRRRRAVKQQSVVSGHTRGRCRQPRGRGAPKEYAMVDTTRGYSCRGGPGGSRVKRFALEGGRSRAPRAMRRGHEGAHPFEEPSAHGARRARDAPMPHGHRQRRPRTAWRTSRSASAKTALASRGRRGALQGAVSNVAGGGRCAKREANPRLLEAKALSLPTRFLHSYRIDGEQDEIISARPLMVIGMDQPRRGNPRHRGRSLREIARMRQQHEFRSDWGRAAQSMIDNRPDWTPRAGANGGTRCVLLDRETDACPADEAREQAEEMGSKGGVEAWVPPRARTSEWMGSQSNASDRHRRRGSIGTHTSRAAGLAATSTADLYSRAATSTAEGSSPPC